MEINSLTPPPHVIKHWSKLWDKDPDAHCSERIYIADRAAKWGAVWGATQSLETALKDTAPVHWRVISEGEEGTQVVRLKDLMSWLDKFREEFQEQM